MIRMFMIAVLWVATLLPAMVHARDMGPLTAYLKSGVSQDGAWKTVLTESGVQMMNSAITRSLNVVQAPAGLPDGEFRHLSVDLALRGNGSESALAGLFYGFDPANVDDPAFYIYALGESGDLGFYRFNGDRYDELWTAPRVKVGKGFNRLEIIEAADSISLWLNGKKMVSLSFATNPRGTAGIIAGGIVDVRFGVFSVSPASGVEAED